MCQARNQYWRRRMAKDTNRSNLVDAVLTTGMRSARLSCPLAGSKLGVACLYKDTINSKLRTRSDEKAAWNLPSKPRPSPWSRTYPPLDRNLGPAQWKRAGDRGGAEQGRRTNPVRMIADPPCRDPFETPIPRLHIMLNQSEVEST